MDKYSRIYTSQRPSKSKDTTRSIKVSVSFQRANVVRTQKKNAPAEQPRKKKINQKTYVLRKGTAQATITFRPGIVEMGAEIPRLQREKCDEKEMEPPTAQMIFAIDILELPLILLLLPLMVVGAI